MIFAKITNFLSVEIAGNIPIIINYLSYIISFNLKQKYVNVLIQKFFPDTVQQKLSCKCSAYLLKDAYLRIVCNSKTKEMT